MSSRLFVGNLSYDATEEEVRDHFAQAGPVSRVFIPLDRDTGRPRGFAFVEFSDPEVAKSALERFNQQPFKDRPLVVNEARPSEARPAGPPRRPPSSDGRPPAPRSSGFRERTTAIPGGLETGREAPARRAAPLSRGAGAARRLSGTTARRTNRFANGEPDAFPVKTTMAKRVRTIQILRTLRRASPTPKTNSPTRRRFLAELLCPLVCLVLFPTDSAAQDALRELNTAIARLTARVTPAVVQIQSDSYARVGSGGPAVAFGPTTGSGVIVSRDGFIVTNAHVVRGATEVQVQLAFVEGPPGRSVIRPSGRRLTGSVIGIDLETDLALVKVDGQDLPTLDLADSEQVRQGQLVLAFGSPLGLENSVTMGVISSVARQLQPDDRVIYIQTDAPINPGNSGGPLVDVDGNVVGINTMILSQSGGSDGVGFALPSNIVASVVEQLRERGVFQRGEIGVEAQSITPELASGLGLAMDHGVILADVHTGGPAYRSDLRVGDVVLSLNDKPMENARQFYVNLYGLVANRVVRLEILRGSERLSKSVTVTVRSDDPERIARLFDSQQELVPRIGILGVAVEDGVQEYLPVLRLPGGILVTALAVTSNAPAGLFLPGDVLYAVNGETLATVEALKVTLSGYAARESVVFQIERQGRLSYVVARLR